MELIDVVDGPAQGLGRLFGARITHAVSWFDYERNVCKTTCGVTLRAADVRIGRPKNLTCGGCRRNVLGTS